MRRSKLLAFCLLLSLTCNALSNNKYRSTNKAYVTANAISNNTIEGEIHYFDFWNDDINHSALYVFFKNNALSVEIEKIELDGAFFTLEILDDRAGFYVIPTKENINEQCIDFQISFRTELTNITSHCIEMVYIPKGKFSLGSAKSFEYRNTKNTSNGSLGAPLNAFFQSGQNGTFNGAYEVGSEKTIEIGDCEGCLNYLDAEIAGVNTYSGDRKGILPLEFPKGFNAFYQMRYELTENQYCDFLNSLDSKQAKNRINPDAIFQGGSRKDYGNFISLKGGIYITSRPNQACSFLSWNDCLAYSDWAGMRIMTEFEFEKSSRGFEKPKFREYSWGGSEIENTYFLDKNLSKCLDNHYCVDGNVHVNYLGFSNYNEVCIENNEVSYVGCRVLSSEMNYRGPLETGIHAKGKKTINRVSTGGGYFGTLDLSGNLREPVVPIGSAGSRKYKGTIGDGKINEDGNTDNLDWLYSNDTELVYGYRGGCWAFHENHARIADRFNVYRKGINVRKPYSGYRGVKNYND